MEKKDIVNHLILETTRRKRYAETLEHAIKELKERTRELQKELIANRAYAEAIQDTKKYITETQKTCGEACTCATQYAGHHAHNEAFVNDNDER